MSSSTIEKSVTIYRGDDEVLLFSGVGPVAGLITLQVAAVFGGQTILQSSSVDGEHGADHAAGKLAFPITAGQSASLPADSMLAYDVKIVDAGVTRSPFYGVFRVSGSITQTEFPVGMSANDVLSLLSDSSDSSKGAVLIGVLQSFWSGVGFAGPFRLQGLLQWLYSKITPRIDPQTGGKLVKTVGTAGAIGESAVSESSGVLDAAGYLEGGNPFLGEHTTDELPEGSSNRYYTLARENAKANVDLTNVLSTDFYDKAVASGAVGGGVSSFNSRSGAVIPQAGDYSASQVSATETGDLSGTTVQAQLEDLDSRVGSNLWGPYPGRTTTSMCGRRTSASPSFPWHPFSETRVFSQAEAPDFFDALYNEPYEVYGESDCGITNAEHGSDYGDTVQLLTFDGSSYPLFKLSDTILSRCYSFYTCETIVGVSAIAFSADASTNRLTFGVPHRLATGDPVTVASGPQTNAKFGEVYYVRYQSPTAVTLHPTEADAGANTNTIDITSTATMGLDLGTFRSELTVTLPGDVGHVLAGTYRITSINGPYVTITGSNNTAGGSVTGSAKFYKHRIAGSTTSVKWHAIEDAALMSMRSDGSLANGLERLDQFQAWQAGGLSGSLKYGYLGAIGNATGDGGPVSGFSIPYFATTTQGNAGRITAVSDGTNGTPRTGAITRPRSVIVEPYVYVGANTLS